jgi:hypothetical protein
MCEGVVCLRDNKDKLTLVAREKSQFLENSYKFPKFAVEKSGSIKLETSGWRELLCAKLEPRNDAI